jgi:hypothetical protein
LPSTDERQWRTPVKSFIWGKDAAGIRGECIEMRNRLGFAVPLTTGNRPRECCADQSSPQRQSGLAISSRRPRGEPVRLIQVATIYPINQELTNQQSDREAAIDSERPETNRADRRPWPAQPSSQEHRYHKACGDKQRLQRIVPPIGGVPLPGRTPQRERARECVGRHNIGSRTLDRIIDSSKREDGHNYEENSAQDRLRVGVRGAQAPWTRSHPTLRAAQTRCSFRTK